MRRATVTAREATDADVPRLVELFDQLRAAGPRRSISMPADTGPLRDAAASRFSHAVADPQQRLLVAERDAGLVGMVLCSIGMTSSLNPTPAVVISHLTVTAGARRAGVGRVLVAAATQWAAECDIDNVRVAVYASSREANRFFARLGFAPLSVNRVAPVSGLRRILGAEVEAAEADSGDVVRRRRLRLAITGSSRTPASARRRSAG